MVDIYTEGLYSGGGRGGGGGGLSVSLRFTLPSLRVHGKVLSSHDLSSPVMCEVNWSKQTNACTLYEHSGQKVIANVR